MRTSSQETSQEVLDNTASLTGGLTGFSQAKPSGRYPVIASIENHKVILLCMLHLLALSSPLLHGPKPKQLRSAPRHMAAKHCPLLHATRQGVPMTGRSNLLVGALLLDVGFAWFAHSVKSLLLEARVRGGHPVNRKRLGWLSAHLKKYPTQHLSPQTQSNFGPDI